MKLKLPISKILLILPLFVLLVIISVSIPVFEVCYGLGSCSSKHSILNLLTYESFDSQNCFKDIERFGDQCLYPINQAFSNIGKCKRDGWDKCMVCFFDCNEDIKIEEWVKEHCDDEGCVFE